MAHELGEAVRTIGFLQIVGHGIDPGEFHRVHDAAGAASPPAADPRGAGAPARLAAIRAAAPPNAARD